MGVADILRLSVENIPKSMKELIINNVQKVTLTLF